MQLNRHLPKVLGILDDMMEHGSFVEVHDAPTELKRQIIAGYFESVLLKDYMTNANIKNIKGFKELAFYLTTNLTALYSYSSLAKATGLSDISVKDYIQALEGSYLFTELKQLSYSLKEQITNRKKPYLADNSFLKLGYSFSDNKGKLLENLVFAELQKQGAELWYYNKESECDFIWKTQTGLIAIQVCHELNDQNLDREVNGLRKLPFDVNEKYIITYNQTDTMDDIKVVPFWEFFSGSRKG